MDHVRDAPQQNNGYDCGIYTAVLAELLASRALASITSVTSPQAEEAVSIGGARSDLLNDDASGGSRGRGGGGIRGGGSGGGGGGDGGGSDDSDGDTEAVAAISPEFVSNARRVARERLSRCVGKAVVAGARAPEGP